ncbi:MAG: Uma2 family endonuclease [Acidobacteria bacterium]|nr:Uma2 family endonuclease [Acidobacteriota bacterium]
MAVRPECRPRLTYDDYAALPDDGVRRQLIDGEVYVVPAPSTRHQRIVGRLQYAVEAHLRARGGGEVLAAPTDVVLSPHDIVQPDLVFVASARAEIVTEANIRGAPSLVAEVLSDPRTADRTVKRDLYARFSVPEYWVVHPEADRVEVFRLGERGYGTPEILEPGETLSTPVLPGLAVDLSELFRR